MEFTATIESPRPGVTGIEVPADVVEALGSGKRPAVVVTVGGFSYRSTIGVMGGRSLIPLSAANREASGVAAGDEPVVGIELDTHAPRAVEVPDDLVEALSGNDDARAFLGSLSYSQQRGYVDWITSAKKDDTRQRRVEQTVQMLVGKRKQR